MKVAAASLLAGAATASFLGGDRSQQVLGGNREPVKLRPAPETVASSDSTWRDVQDAFGPLTAEAWALWEQLRLLGHEMPGPSSFISQPKKHARRPDSHWDHIVRGADVQKV